MGPIVRRDFSRCKQFLPSLAHSGGERRWVQILTCVEGAYLKAVQEERVIRGEPSDRLNVVQQQSVDIGERYDVLKELLKDEEFRKFSDRVLLMQEEMRAGRRGDSG